MEIQINNSLQERGLNAQRKTIEGIFEFAQCVVELKESSKIIQGGSNFRQLAFEWWGISSQGCNHWIMIGKQLETLKFNFKVLPRSY